MCVSVQGCESLPERVSVDMSVCACVCVYVSGNACVCVMCVRAD